MSVVICPVYEKILSNTVHSETDGYACHTLTQFWPNAPPDGVHKCIQSQYHGCTQSLLTWLSRYVSIILARTIAVIAKLPLAWSDNNTAVDLHARLVTSLRHARSPLAMYVGLLWKYSVLTVSNFPFYWLNICSLCATSSTTDWVTNSSDRQWDRQRDCFSCWRRCASQFVWTVIIYTWPCSTLTWSASTRPKQPESLSVLWSRELRSTTKVVLRMSKKLSTCCAERSSPLTCTMR